jgi:hypothetical protein
MYGAEAAATVRLIPMISQLKPIQSANSRMDSAAPRKQRSPRRMDSTPVSALRKRAPPRIPGANASMTSITPLTSR